MKRILAFGVLMLVLLLPLTALAAPPRMEDAISMLSNLNITVAGENNIVLSGQDAVVPLGKEVENVAVFGADARISGRVRGEVVALGGSIYLESSAVVDGSVVAIGGSIEMAPGAKVYGEQIRLGLGFLNGLWPTIGSFAPRFWKSSFTFGRFLSMIFLGGIAFWLFPKHIFVVAETVEDNPGKATLFGLLAYLALVPLTVTLVITILGIPLIPLLWLGVLAGRFLGQIALGLLAGRWLAPQLKWETTDLVMTLLGLTVLGLATFLPYIGSLASLFYGLIGFGAVVWSRMGTKSPLEIEQ